MASSVEENSFWFTRHPLKQRYQSLSSSQHTDVAILGAGITGLSVALELLHRGRSVAIFDASVLGMGTTGASAGHLDAHPETTVAEFKSKHGTELARQFVRLRQDAISAIEYRAADRCDFFRVPAFMYSDDETDRPVLSQDQQTASKIGLETSWVDSVPFPIAAVGYRVARMARFDSMAYVLRLAELVVEAGGKIYENTPVDRVEAASKHELHSGDAVAQFDHLVYALHGNPSDIEGVCWELTPFQTYALLCKVSNPPIDALFWDNNEPYHHTRRLDTRSTHIIVGGRDHMPGEADPVHCFEQLEGYVRDRFEVEAIENRWSAILYESTDGLPIIGRIPGRENVWIATGLSGVGLTLGTAAGWLIADDICGRPAPWIDALAPSRFTK